MLSVAEALTAMGYREVMAGKWAKPIAYMLFTYEEHNHTWTNWFKAATGELSVYNRHTLYDDVATWGSYLDQIKAAEFDTRTNLFAGESNGIRSEFELSPYI